MIRESDIRYVVAVIQGGIWYTLANDEKIYWNFDNQKIFKASGWAIKAANRVIRRYFYDKIYVFKVRFGDTLSSDSYKKWAGDDSRIVIKHEACNC